MYIIYDEYLRCVSRSEITVRAYRSSYPMIAGIPSIAIRSSSMIAFYLLFVRDFSPSDLSPFSQLSGIIYIYFFFSDTKSKKLLLKKTKSKNFYNTLYTVIRTCILKFRLSYVRTLCVYMRKKNFKKRKRERDIDRQKRYCLSIETFGQRIKIISIQSSLSTLFKRNNSVTAHKSDPIIFIYTMPHTYFHLYIHF